MLLANAVFTTLDWIVLAGYFVGITAFGLWIARKISSSQGYFLGDRKLPWYVMMGQAFGTGTHAENPVAQAGVTYQFGFATIWYQWKNMLITPFYWLMAPWYRRCQRTTIGELVEDRYGRTMAGFYTLFAMAYFVLNQGTMMKGAGKAISMATGGQIISPNQVVLVMVVAFLLYSFFGGLVASAYTDFVQSFLILAMSFMLIPAGLYAVGGFSGMRQSLPENFFELYNEASGVGVFAILMLTLNGFVGITAQPHILTMNATGKTERAGRIGQTYGNFVKRLCTIGWALTGLLVAAMLIKSGSSLDDREKAFGYACLHLLAPGLTGLMAACILAANMSTCSNFMVNSGALFTRNFYTSYVRPDATDRELLLVGRLAGLGLTLLGILFALAVDKVLDAFMLLETLPAFFGIAIMGGFLWKRANRQGALAAVLASLFSYYAINWYQAGRLMFVYKWFPAPYGLATLIGIVVFIVVSLVTREEDPGRIDAFFDRMNHSSDPDAAPQPVPPEPAAAADGDSAVATVAPVAVRTVPLAADRGQDLILLDLPGWFTRRRWVGFFHRYREDLVGFALGWLTVGALLGLAWAIMQIGT